MSKVDLPALEQRMLSGEPFTYRELKCLFTADNDLHGNVHATIIKLRDAGMVAWKIEGGRPVWRAVKQQDSGTMIATQSIEVIAEALELADNFSAEDTAEQIIDALDGGRIRDRQEA